MANECVVYHKHLAGMDLTDGYIGISKNFEERMKQHHRDAFVKNSIYTVHERMRMHGDEVITSKIFEGSINECFDYEEELRPNWRMGWNMAIGGGRPGSGWKPSKKWLDNRLWHPEHGEVTINKEFTTPDLARKYLHDIRASTNICHVLEGNKPHAYKWEFADAQLANRVKERYSKAWEVGYLKRETEVIKLYKTGLKEFATKKCNRKSSGLPMKHIMNGCLRVIHNWELASEEEWLETAERVEFK